MTLRGFRLAAPALLALLATCSESTVDPVPADNPTPGIVALTPSSFQQGAGDQQITISGSDFVSTSSARVNGGPRTTTFINASEIRANLSAGDLAAPATLQITVVNPPPGGGTSNAVPLTVGAPPNPGNPLPTIVGFTPDFVNAGSPAMTVTINGTGFLNESLVLVGDLNHGGVSYASANQLRVAFTATELEASAALSIRVVNPAPGGGPSNPRTLEIRSPLPTLAALSTNQTTAGQAAFSLSVTGTGFVRNSVLRFNGAPRPTTFVSGTALTMIVGEGDMQATGTFEITVLNPAPGGGASNGLPFQLVTGLPAITSLPSLGAHAGRPGFSMTVHGTGFVSGSRVRWNGTERPTQYIASTRLMAEVSAADVAAAGTAQVTVINPSGGGQSNSAVMTIRPVPAATTTATRVLNLPARDLAPDDARGVIYLSIGPNAIVDPNSVVAIDQASGAVTRRVFVGSDLGRMARSDDGQFLYVGVNGASAVRRVEVATFTAGLQWSLPGGDIAGEIRVLPGLSRSVAISRQQPGLSPPLSGVSIYDDGVGRPQSTPGHTGGNRIEFLDSPQVLYGYNNAHTGFEFFTIAIDAAGASHALATPGLISGHYTQITGAAGRIYGSDGSVVDAGRRTRVGTFAVSGWSVAVDAALGRAFVLRDGTIDAFDLNNFQFLGSVPLSGVEFGHPAGHYAHLVRWGTDGLAFLDADQVFLIQSPLFAP